MLFCGCIYCKVVVLRSLEREGYLFCYYVIVLILVDLFVVFEWEFGYSWINRYYKGRGIFLFFCGFRILL